MGRLIGIIVIKKIVRSIGSPSFNSIEQIFICLRKGFYIWVSRITGIERYLRFAEQLTVPHRECVLLAIGPTDQGIGLPAKACGEKMPEQTFGAASADVIQSTF